MLLPRYQRQVALGVLCTALLGLIAMLVLGLGPAEAAQAANTDLPCDVDALIAAIQVANDNDQADTLNLAAGCTYTLTAVDNNTDGPNGLPAISSDLTIYGRGATIERSDAPGTAPFRIFYVAWDSALTLNQLTLRNGDPGTTDGGGIYNRGRLTLSGSTVSGNAGSAIKDLLGTVILTDTTVSDNGAGIGSYGGTVVLDSSTVSDNAGAGISVNDSGLTLTGSTVSDNQGAGIVGDRAAIRLTDSAVTGNTAAGDGGGIASYSDRGDSLTLTDSTVAGNSAAGNSAAGDGGGIWVTGDVVLDLVRTTVSDNVSAGAGGGLYISLCAKDRQLSLTDSTVSGNEAATWGGGIYNEEGMLTLTNTTVDHNRAGDAGGGISNAGGTLTLDHSAATRNEAPNAGGGILNTGGGAAILTASRVHDNRGGGLYNDGAMTVAGSTISDNEATQGMGGGIEHRGGTLSLANSTVSGNAAGEAGGGLYGKSLGTISLSSTTISDNRSAKGAGLYSHGPVNLLHTIVAGQLDGSNCDGPGMLISQGHNLDGDGTCIIGGVIGDITDPDPHLGPLQDNGGPTETHALLPGSPAIEAGDDATCPAADQRGVPRPQDDNTTACDIGAYETE